MNWRNNPFKTEYPLLYHSVYWEDYPIQQLSQLDKEQAQLIREYPDLFSRGERYLLNRMNDSWVVSMEQTEQTLTLHLNEFGAHCLFDAIVETLHLNIPHHKRIASLDLVLHRPTKIGLYRLNGNHRLIPLSRRKYTRLDEYLYDEVKVLPSGQIGYACVLTLARQSRRGNLYVVAHCRGRATELCRTPTRSVHRHVRSAVCNAL